MRLDAQVELNLNEQWVVERFEELLDAGRGIVDAVVGAMTEFASRYPEVVDYPFYTPVHRDLLIYLIGDRETAVAWAQDQGFDLHNADLQRHIYNQAGVI